MLTFAQAAEVAKVTGWPRLKSEKDPSKFSRRLDAGDSFEIHRLAVEAVSVLFQMYEQVSDGLLREVPSGWQITAAKFEVEWPAAASAVSSHFGARRYAYNWALGQVKTDLEAKKLDPLHIGVKWTLPELRKVWNQSKDTVAPWWASNSKEAYSCGIADLVQGLSNWSSSKAGKRAGAKVSFPRFKSRNKDHGRVRFTTGVMRLEEDRRGITLPVIGTLRSKENTRRVQRHLAKGNAHLLSLTLLEQWGRLFVAVNYAVRTPEVKTVSKPGVKCGVDLGLRTLATVADSEGNFLEFPNPAPLRETLSKRRLVNRQMSRRILGSRGYWHAKAKLAKLDRRAVNIRLETWHQLTTKLTNTYDEVVIEDLNIAAMKRSMGRRAFRRSVSDAALGQFRPMLGYKKLRTRTKVTIADRWWSSSQIHHDCGCRLIAPTKLAKKLICAVTGEEVDRDRNAALNLRDYDPEELYVSTNPVDFTPDKLCFFVNPVNWPDLASCGSVEATAPVDTRADQGGKSLVGTDPGSDVGVPNAGGVAVRLLPRMEQAAVRPEPNRRQGLRGGTPQGVSTR
jgi:putative transposase